MRRRPADRPSGTCGHARAARAVALAVALLLAATATAEAGRRKRKRVRSYPVEILSRPKGARVTLDTGEVVGRTPLRTELPAGTQIVTLTRRGYRPFEYALEVTSKRRKNRWRFRLARVTAIEVSADVPGAEIYIDGKRVGTAPRRVELGRGAYQVEIRKRGYVSHEAFVELRRGVETIDVTLEPLESGGGAVAAQVEETAPTEDEPLQDDTARDRDDAPRGPRSRWFAVGGGLEIGARRFRYANPQTANMRDFDAGLPMVRLSAELYPFAGMRSRGLSGIAVTGRFARGAPANSDTTDGQTVATRFGDLDVGLAWRLPLGRPSLDQPGYDLGAGVSYGRQYFSFDETNPIHAEVPDVDYRYLRLSIAGGSRVGRYRAFGQISYDMVQSAGVLADRFTSDDVMGLGGSAGLSVQIVRALELRFAASAVRYKHSFRFEDSAEHMADGAADQFFGLTAVALYAY